MELDEVLALYERSQRRRNIRASTVDRQRRTLRAFGHWLEPTDLADATAADVEKWLDERRLAPRSRYTYLTTLSAFFVWATRDGHAEENPVDAILRPKLPRLLPRPVSPADVEYAIGQADPMMRAWLCLAAFQGFRCIEIANQRRDDVHEHDDPPFLIVTEGKGGKERTVPLHPTTLAALRPFLCNARHLFVMSSGEPWKPGTVSVYGSKYLRSIGVPASMHQLRHHFGTQVFKRSRDLRLTQELMGHDDPKSTAIYVAYDVAEAVEVVRSLGGAAERPVITSPPERA